MDTHHPGDSGFWILGVGRMSRVEGPSDSGFWILDTGRRRSEVPVGRAGSDSGFWILDTGQSVGGPGWEGRRTLDSGYWILGSPSEVPGGRAAWILDSWILDTRRSVGGPGREGRRTLDSGFWILGGRRSREGCRTLDSGFWKLGAVVCSGGSVPPGFWILGFWILQSATRLDSGFLDSGFCSPPLGTAWILDSWILETARIQNPDARILDPGFWILDSAQRASAHMHDSTESAFCFLRTCNCTCTSDMHLWATGRGATEAFWILDSGNLDSGILESWNLGFLDSWILQSACPLHSARPGFWILGFWKLPESRIQMRGF